MIAWGCPINPREASGRDPEAVHQAAELMCEHGVRRLPVCDADDELVGIITADDLTELLADEQQQLADVIRAQRPPY